MTVIVVASNKGGVGKTTISILLAEELAYRGYSVAVVESDEERHIANYLANREHKEQLPNFELFSDEDASTLGKTIRLAEESHDIVVADLPGFGGLQFTRAVARANLVLIPMKPSLMDNNSATNAIEQIAIEEDHLARKIEHRIVLNMVKDAKMKERAVGVDRSERALREHLKVHNFPVLNAEMSLRRGAFVSFYTYASTLPEMIDESMSSSTESLERGYREIVQLGEEVLETLGIPGDPKMAQEMQQEASA